MIKTPTDKCLIWDGSKDRYGYGQTKMEGRVYRVHRLSYEAAKGKIPAELVLDHLCRNRACYNPRHLEAVTHKENILRGVGLAAKNAIKTECLHGHKFNYINTYITKSLKRVCRICDNLRKRNR